MVQHSHGSIPVSASTDRPASPLDIAGEVASVDPIGNFAERLVQQGIMTRSEADRQILLWVADLTPKTPAVLPVGASVPGLGRVDKVIPTGTPLAPGQRADQDHYLIHGVDDRFYRVPVSDLPRLCPDAFKPSFRLEDTTGVGTWLKGGCVTR